MIAYRTVPIPEVLAREVRTTLRAPGYGHPAHAEVAKGYGPCRSCLKTFEEGCEERILFTYDPFAELDPYPAPGPVFVHRVACIPYDRPGFPEGLRPLPLFLEGYGRGRWLVSRERVAGGDVEASVERLFGHSAVDYIHVRNAEAGCYIARIERMAGAGEEVA